MKNLKCLSNWNEVLKLKLDCSIFKKSFFWNLFILVLKTKIHVTPETIWDLSRKEIFQIKKIEFCFLFFSVTKLIDQSGPGNFGQFNLCFSIFVNCPGSSFVLKPRPFSFTCSGDVFKGHFSFKLNVCCI